MFPRAAANQRARFTHAGLQDHLIAHTFAPELAATGNAQPNGSAMFSTFHETHSVGLKRFSALLRRPIAKAPGRVSFLLNETLTTFSFCACARCACARRAARVGPQRAIQSGSDGSIT